MKKTLFVLLLILSAEGRAGILSAFHGVERTMVPGAGPDINCIGVLGLSAMPLVMSTEILNSSLQASDIRIRLEDGRVLSPRCVTLSPANQPDEDRTILTFGDFGSPDNRPVEVEIVGNLFSEDGSMNHKGSRAPVIPLEEGPRIVWIEPASVKNCPSGSRVSAVRVIWTGGITVMGQELEESDWQKYSIRMRDSSGGIRTLIPNAVVDLNDGDNNHELCFSVSGTVIEVQMPADGVTDPNGDWNPDTTFSTGSH